MKLLIATHNRGKLREYAELFRDLPYELVTLDDVGITADVAETAMTFLENARLKAVNYAKQSGLLALADDSGLEVDALGGEPGVYSKRYSGQGKGDADRNAYLLDKLRAVPTAERTARFRCVIVVADHQGEMWQAEGTCEGTIAFEPRGSNGFGYDPIFIVPEFGKHMAELPSQVKNRISHRGQAAQAIYPILAELARVRLTTSKHAIQGLYDRAAPMFDRSGPRFFYESARCLVARMTLAEGGRVLDLATGRGANLVAALECSHGKGIGVDLSEAMLEALQQDLSASRVPAQLCCMDAEALGLCAGSFDAVMCGFAIFWFVNQERAIQEAVRVLKPGGQFGLSMGAGTDPRWDWYRALVDEYVKRHKLRTDFGATGYVPLEVLTERLRRAGFGEIQSAVEELEFVYRDADEWWEAQWSHGTRAPLEQMQVEVLEEFREKALKEVRNMHAAGGIFQAWPLQLVVATRL